jgi:hypothetical protein
LKKELFEDRGVGGRKPLSMKKLLSVEKAQIYYENLYFHTQKKIPNILRAHSYFLPSKF